MSARQSNLNKLPLEVRAERALKEAVEEVIQEHIRSGRPIHIWRDGKVVEIPAQSLRAGH
jgi:hypothetical protein